MTSILRPDDQRIKLDAYYTPDPLAIAITKRVLELVDHRVQIVIEPSSGGGAFVAACRKELPDASIHAVDINPDAEKAAKPHCSRFWLGDWKTFEGSFPAHLIIGNPPYSEANEHLEAALRFMRKSKAFGHDCYTAFLLRITFLGSRSRVRFYTSPEFPLRYLIPIVPRPTYDGEGTDLSEYGVFVWGTKKGPSVLTHPLVWKRSGKDQDTGELDLLGGFGFGSSSTTSSSSKKGKKK